MCVVTVAWSADTFADGADPSDPVRAYVNADGAVVVSWLTPKWDNDLAGFMLARAEVSPDALADEFVWEPIGEELIRPNLDIARLRRLKLDKVLEQRDRLDPDRLASDVVLAKLISSPEEMKKLSLMAGIEPQWAVALGMGWIDRDARLGRTYRYRVHKAVAAEDGSFAKDRLVGQVKIEAVRNAIVMPRLESWTVSRTHQHGWVRLNWSIRADELSGRTDLLGFDILVGLPDEPLQNKISWVFKSGGIKSEDGQLIRFSTIKHLDDDGARQFALQPFGLGGNTGPLSQPFLLPGVGGSLGRVEDLTVELRDGAAVLRWKYDSTAVGHFAGFRIQRYQVKDHKEGPAVELTPELLAMDRRVYVDEGILDTHGGQTVSYYVRAISGDPRDNSDAARQVVKLPDAGMASSETSDVDHRKMDLPEVPSSLASEVGVLVGENHAEHKAGNDAVEQELALAKATAVQNNALEIQTWIANGEDDPGAEVFWRIVEERRLAGEKLLKGLQSSDEVIRARSAYLLGLYGFSEHVDRMLEHIEMTYEGKRGPFDKRPWSNRPVFQALCRLGKPASLSAIQQIISERDPHRQRLCATLICSIEGPETAIFMLDKAASEQEDSQTKAKLIDVAQQIKTKQLGPIWLEEESGL